jgi:hypothetical protein
MQRQVRLIALLMLCGVAHAEPKSWDVSAKIVDGALRVELRATGDYHLNDDYPIHLDLATDPNVRFATTRIDRAAIQLAPCKEPAHSCAATVTAPFRATGAGRAGGTLAFAVCNADRCVIEKSVVSAAVPAKK